MKYILSILFLVGLIACHTGQGYYGTKDKKAIKLFEAGRTCFNSVSHITGRRDQLPCAEESFLKALERDPSFMEALSMLSNVYVEKNDIPKAIETKEKMLMTGKKVSDYEYYYLAYMSMKIGNYQKSKKYAKYYTQIHNPNQDMLNKCYRFMDNADFAMAAMKNPSSISPKNMGPNVNTNRPEYFPSITADDKTFLFTRDVLDSKAKHGGHQEDIFVTTSPSPTEWTYGKNVSSNVNTIYNEGAPTFSADGKYIIMVGCETGLKGEYDYGADRKGYGSCDLFVSEKIGKEWTRPVNMGKPINTGHFESQPSFSSDGKTLYFVRGVIPKGSLREPKHQDIYMSEIQSDGTWSTPKKLGSNINTPLREESVQIHPDGQTLYFSSEGHTGMGGLDIFMSRLQPDGTWGKAINLGYPINSHKDENSLLVSSKGDVAFYASNREGGYGSLDLYQFDLPKKFQPIETTFMKGTVYDSISRKPLAADFQLIDLSSGLTFKRAIANSGNGEFIVAIPKNKNFGLIAEHDGYFFYSKNYNLDKLAKNDEGFLLDVPMLPIKKGDTFVLENVFFDVDKSTLKKESIAELTKLKNILDNNTSMKIELGGHTDSDGDDAHNLKLSDDRANAVKNWLIEKGISEERIEAKGYGEGSPIVLNDSKENKAKNRRTEVIIL